MRGRAGQVGTTTEVEPAPIQQFRELASSDNGREFWTVHLMAFRGDAMYPPDLALALGKDPTGATSR